MITEDDFTKSLNKQTFYLSIIEAMSRNLCKKGQRFLEHICNGYFFNCYSENDIHQINVFSDPVKQKQELEMKERRLEEMFYHIEIFRTRIIPKYRYKILCSKYFNSQIQNLTSEELLAINEIWQNLTTGESVKDFYSTSVFNAFSNKCVVEDKLLNAFNIKHLNLKKGKKKGNKILLFIQNNYEIYLIGFFMHDIFKDRGLSGKWLKEIIEIIESDFPQYLQSRVLRGGSNFNILDLQYENWASHNIPDYITTAINCGVVPMVHTKFGILTLGGDKQMLHFRQSIFVRNRINIIANDIYQALKSQIQKEVKACRPAKYLLQNDGIYIIWNFNNKTQNKVDLINFSDLTPITFLKNLCYLNY